MPAAWQATITDESGTIQPSAIVEVLLESNGASAALFSDRAGATPISNPVTADANGFVRFYTAGGAYRITATLGAFSREWRHVAIGLLGEFDSLDSTVLRYERTVSEIAAGVTPTNYAYQELNVRRYGAVGDGSTNDAPAVQQAIDVAKEIGGTVIFPNTTDGFLLTSPLDVTIAHTNNQYGITFRGEASQSTDIPHIIARHNGHVFDCAGADALNFADLTILGNANSVGHSATDDPLTCFFLARNTSGGNSQIHRFKDVRVVGRFQRAILYNYGSEDGKYDGCLWFNRSTNAGSKVVAITAWNNISPLSSTFITIATGQQSCIDHEFFGGQFLNQSTDAAADIFWLDQANATKVYGPWFACHGRSYVYVDTTNADSSRCSFMNITGEDAVNLPTYGFYFGDTARTPTNWKISHCYLPNDTMAIAAHTSVTLDRFYIDAIAEQTSHGIQCNILQDSVLDTGGVPLTITTSRWNRLSGDVDNWTITTRTNDYWIDQRVTKTWTADLSALTIGGVLNVNRGRSLAHGTLVTVNLVLQSNTSIVCAAGVAIGDLPFVPGEFSADVKIMNQTDNTEIAGGYVEQGGDLILPAINVTTKVLLITATYLAVG